MNKTVQESNGRVKVVVRIRPPYFDNKDTRESKIKIDQHNKTISIQFEDELEQKQFHFDYIYNSSASTSCIYDRSVSPLVNQVLQGRVSTVIAYGQSGSGKTSTIVGLRSLAVNEIFSRLSKEEQQTLSVKLSCIEIYQDFVRDILLNNVKTSSKSKQRKYLLNNINDFMWRKANSCQDIERIFHLVDRKRQCSSTKLNSSSSRSHLIITLLIVDESCNGKQSSRKLSRVNVKQHASLYISGGRLTFVDLAGSERLKRSESKGVTLLEACKINQSLNALNNVILCIKERKKYIPYRDSKLTMILSDAIGGCSHTLMITNISQAKADVQETLYTLRFAEITRGIKNTRVLPIHKYIVAKDFNHKRNDVGSTSTTNTTVSSMKSSFHSSVTSEMIALNDLRKLQITVNSLRNKIQKEYQMQRAWTSHLHKLIRTSRNLSVESLLSILSKNADELSIVYSKIIIEMRLQRNFMKQVLLTNKELENSRQIFNDLMNDLKRKVQECKQLEKVYKGCQKKLMRH